MTSSLKKILTIAIAIIVVAAIAFFFGRQLVATDDDGEYATMAETEVVVEEIVIPVEDEVVEEVPAEEAPVEEVVEEAVEEVPAEETAEAVVEETLAEEQAAEEIQTEVPAEETVAEETLAETQTQTEEKGFQVNVKSSLEGQTTVKSGTEVTLTADVSGFEGYNYSIKWQRSLDGSTWEDIEGANESTYKMTLTKETGKYQYRAYVSWESAK